MNPRITLLEAIDTALLDLGIAIRVERTPIDLNTMMIGQGLSLMGNRHLVQLEVSRRFPYRMRSVPLLAT
jgi:hypothetical protein